MNAIIVISKDGLMTVIADREEFATTFAPFCFKGWRTLRPSLCDGILLTQLFAKVEMTEMRVDNAQETRR